MATQTLTVTQQPLDVTAYDAAAVMPIMDRNAAKVRYQAMVDFVGDILREGLDFGTVPGTGDKPTLLKPGAEKLATFFGLSKRFALVEKVEDWTGEDHGGEPLFYYLYRCQLYRGELLIAECDGSANSWESKYRYRRAERVCPHCGQTAIIKGREEYGGGWLCFAKKGGCGAKFKAGDRVIEEQEVGRIINPDPADIVNTLQKMSQKRALVGATLLAVNGSDYFTQDVEDYIEADYSVTPQLTQASLAPKNHRVVVEQPGGNGQQAPADPLGFAVWGGWRNANDAKAWAMTQGKFNAQRHMENAYDKVKADRQPTNARDMWLYWYEYVTAHEPTKNIVADDEHLDIDLPTVGGWLDEPLFS